jgi:hypothetical protein
MSHAHYTISPIPSDGLLYWTLRKGVNRSFPARVAATKAIDKDRQTG